MELRAVGDQALVIGKDELVLASGRGVLVRHDDAVLANYELKALTQGSDAKGEVIIKLSEHGHSFTGIGIDSDVIVASCRAYIDALNRMLAGRNVVPPAKVKA